MIADYTWKPNHNEKSHYVGSTQRINPPDPSRQYKVKIGNKTHELYFSKIFSSWAVDSGKPLPLRLTEEQATILCNK